MFLRTGLSSFRTKRAAISGALDVSWSAVARPLSTIATRRAIDPLYYVYYGSKQSQSEKCDDGGPTPTFPPLLDGGMSDAQLTELFNSVSNTGKWGAEDQRGTLNYLGKAETAAAGALVRDGTVVSLGRDIPTYWTPSNPFPAQHYMLKAGDDPVLVPGMELCADYIGIASHGFGLTHMDALCHVFAKGKSYNNRPCTDVKSTGAFTNSIMACREGLVGRGVLLDIPRALGVEFVAADHLITTADLLAAERKQGVTVRKGDLLVVRVGRDKRDAAVKEAYPPKLAGLHPRTVTFLHERQVAVMGSDAAHDPMPSHQTNVDWALPIHMLALAGMGLHLIDNLALESLAEACAARSRYEFQLVLAPLAIPGGTASPLNPIAIF